MISNSLEILPHSIGVCKSSPPSRWIGQIYRNFLFRLFSQYLAARQDLGITHNIFSNHESEDLTVERYNRMDLLLCQNIIDLPLCFGLNLFIEEITKNFGELFRVLSGESIIAIEDIFKRTMVCNLEEYFA